MTKEATSLHTDRQHVALVLSNHLSRARVSKKTARRFSWRYELEGVPRKEMKKRALVYLHSSQQEQPQGFQFEDAEAAEKMEENIDTIRREIATRQEQRLQEKEEKGFSASDRAVLLFKAKSKRLSGQTEEERVQMYKEAGYTDKEIEGITGKKFAVSTAVTMGLAGFSLSARVGASLFDKIVPFSDILPGNTGVAASIASYTGSYVVFAGQNLRLTKDKEGTSANAPLTVLYYAGNRLVSSRTRDLIAVGAPTAANTVFYGGLYTAIVEGTTGSSNKVIAANVVSTGLNLLYSAGAEAWIRHKERKVKKAA